MAIYPPGKTQKDIDELYKRAYAETKIIYPKKAKMFSAKLRNLNKITLYKGALSRLSVGVFDFLLDFYYGLKNGFKKVVRKIYPRRDKIYGTKKDTYVTGKITFAKKQDLITPIHHMHVELWARTWLGAWRKLAKGITDENGKIMLKFDFLESRKLKYRRFYFEIHQTEHIFFDPNTGQPREKISIFANVKIKKADITGLGYNLGLIQLFYWEYRTDVPIPRVVIKDHDEDAPEYYSEGRNQAIAEQFVQIELIKDKHLLQIERGMDNISIPSIQADYPKNLTVAMEEGIPYSTRCDYWFGRRMMNGMSSATFLPDKNEEGKYWVKIFGSCDYEVNQVYAFPTTYCQFELAENGLPLPVKIIIKGQTDAFDKNPFQEKTFTPDDGERWEQAKRIMRVTSALSSEVDDHFAGTHLNTEQYAIAVRRNVRLNPVAELLIPHLKEVSLINHTADSNLIGNGGYIPSASALTVEGIVERSKDALGIHDWKNWKPMEPISEEHTFALASNLFWDIVNEFVDFFFNENENEIKKHWYEIFCMSNDLVCNSVPLFLSEQDQSKWSEEKRKLNEDRIEYYHERACFDAKLPRETYQGKVRCISPITKNPYGPEDGGMDNLKSMCKYTIMTATFLHTYVNEHQYEDIGEVLYCNLGLRYGEKKDGIFQPENDYSIFPDLTRSTQMMWFSNLLSRTEYGFITRNEEHDIHPYFSKLLLDKKEEFAKLNVDVECIESRTNI